MVYPLFIFAAFVAKFMSIYKSFLIATFGWSKNPLWFAFSSSLFASDTPGTCFEDVVLPNRLYQQTFGLHYHGVVLVYVISKTWHWCSDENIYLLLSVYIVVAYFLNQMEYLFFFSIKLKGTLRWCACDAVFYQIRSGFVTNLPDPNTLKLIY